MRGRSRAARRAAGIERRGGANGGDLWSCHRGRGAPALGVRPQELLLPGPAEGLSDQPVRTADRRRGQAHDHFRGRQRTRGRHHASAPRGRRGQVGARRFSRTNRDRSEPRGHPAARGRIGARPAHTRGSGRLLPPHAQPGALPAHLRWQPGGGQHALRRQRVRPAPRRERVWRAHGNQEPELVPIPRARHRNRNRAPDRRARKRRTHSPRDTPVRPRPQRDAGHARQGAVRGLPLLPRPRPDACGARAGLYRSDRGHPARAAGRPARALPDGAWTYRLRCRMAHRRPGPCRLFRGRRRRCGRCQAGCELGDGRSVGRAQSGECRDHGLAGRPPRACCAHPAHQGRYAVIKNGEDCVRGALVRRR